MELAEAALRVATLDDHSAIQVSMIESESRSRYGVETTNVGQSLSDGERKDRPDGGKLKEADDDGEADA